MKIHLCSAGLMALALSVPMAAEETDKSLKLKAGPLPIDKQALSPSAYQTRWLPPIRMTSSTGIVLPADFVEIKKTGSATICGVALDFTYANDGLSVSTGGGKAVKLKMSNTGSYESFPVPLANKRSAVISIPGLQRTPGGVNVFFRSGVAMSGLIDGDAVVLYDDNLDGTYTVEKDAFSVNSGIVYGRLKGWLPTSKGLYRVSSVDETGTKLDYQVASESTGKLELKYASTLADAHLVFSTKELDAVVTGRKPVTVLSGSYQLAYGLLVNPQTRTTYAGILNTPASKPVEIPSGAEKPVIVAMGGPYRFDFEVTAPNRKITINPGSFVVTGKGDEKYIEYRWKGMPTVTLNGKPLGTFEYG